MIPFRKTIGFRLLAVSFILLTLPLLVDSFILIQNRYRATIVDAKEYLVEVAQMRDLPFSQMQPVKKPLLEIFTHFLHLQDHFQSKEDKQLDQELKQLSKAGDFYGIFLLKITEDGKYEVVASSNEEYVGRDYTDLFKTTALFSEEDFARGYTNYITYGRTTDIPFFLVAHIIFSEVTGEPEGILVVAKDVTSNIQTVLAPDMRKYPVNFAVLLPSSIVFAATDPDFRFQHFLPLSDTFREKYEKEIPFNEGPLPENPLPVDDESDYPFFEFTWEDEAQIGYIKTFPATDLALLAYSEKKEIFKLPIQNFFKIYLVYFCILLFGGILAYLLIHRMAKPMRNISRVMLSLQKGDLETRYQADPFGFEINRLGDIYNRTIDAVIEKKQQAQEERVQKETLAQELYLGREVQRNLFPEKMPTYPTVDLAESYIPAIEVGGDFYDAFVREIDGREQLVLGVADASGKGVQACFYSLILRNILRVFAREFEDIGKAIAEANNLFQIDTAETGMFVTAVMGIYDMENREFHYYSAGHNPILVRRQDGSVEYLNHMGIAMGIFHSEGEFHPHSTRLERGDTLVLYSDGITEAHDPHNHLFGEKRLALSVQEISKMSASSIVEEILQAVSGFTGEAPQHDDITLLVMHIYD